ncbi:Bacteroides conjugative transposon TraN protein [Mucilaginibacter pineti]|uniref:Bacteroides conjugative transposon TraN protein n=1 Tax=Mucilaginibacter pineti TaxID=1391627 RepID=A0A1G7IFE8_9SPHI|nr:conjugative transposon protein TraN [Mucilaginibacter pineti]SDF11345.1 Bacteroides conjugative transposon TraN protein [Mucilaginibacter pineti]
MKTMILSFFLLLSGLLSAQVPQTIQSKDLPVILLARDMTLHLVSPEPIRYVDISSHAIAGDLPLGNVLRLKVVPDSAARLQGGPAGIVTVTGESFIAQYQLQYLPDNRGGQTSAQVDITPGDTRPLDHSGVSVSTPQMKAFALRLAGLRPEKIRQSDAYGIEATLNHVYTYDDLVFLDISYHNSTNLGYQPDELRFKIEDKKIKKATNVQSVEIKPIWQLYQLSTFKNRTRNIYVLKKAPFPENKILNIELTEKQISGRTVSLQIKYKDILKADTF